MDYDVFISHASEDKQDVAQPLAEMLTGLGLKVWFDGSELKLGDSLRQSIDHGLAKSRFGVVVLSESFFSKEWPQMELDGLFASETGRGGKVILPIWHNISPELIQKYSPLVAARLAARTTDGLYFAAQRIAEIVENNRSDVKSVNNQGSFVPKRKTFAVDILRKSDEQVSWRRELGEQDYTNEDIVAIIAHCGYEPHDFLVSAGDLWSMGNRLETMYHLPKIDGAINRILIRHMPLDTIQYFSSNQSDFLPKVDVRLIDHLQDRILSIKELYGAERVFVAPWSRFPPFHGVFYHTYLMHGLWCVDESGLITHKTMVNFMHKKFNSKLFERYLSTFMDGFPSISVPV